MRKFGTWKGYSSNKEGTKRFRCNRKKQLYVADRYRTNPLSLKPGGYTIKVCKNGKILVYDKIKDPEAYVEKIGAKLLWYD